MLLLAAQAVQPAPEAVSVAERSRSPAIVRRCNPADGDEIVVCGRNETERYRLPIRSQGFRSQGAGRQRLARAAQADPGRGCGDRILLDHRPRRLHRLLPSRHQAAVSAGSLRDRLLGPEAIPALAPSSARDCRWRRAPAPRGSCRQGPYTGRRAGNGSPAPPRMRRARRLPSPLRPCGGSKQNQTLDAPELHCRDGCACPAYCRVGRAVAVTTVMGAGE